MRIEWTPALSVGNDAIDAQHRELFRRADALLVAIHAGKPERVGEVLNFLNRYAVEHFGLEEAWMREHRFRGYLRHKAEHDRFVADLVALADEHERIAKIAIDLSHGRAARSFHSAQRAELGRARETTRQRWRALRREIEGLAR